MAGNNYESYIDSKWFPTFKPSEPDMVKEKKKKVDFADLSREEKLAELDRRRQAGLKDTKEQAAYRQGYLDSTLNRLSWKPFYKMTENEQDAIHEEVGRNKDKLSERHYQFMEEYIEATLKKIRGK